jgi:hypothetical protein
MQLVVNFADVRVLAFGVLNKSKTMFLNSNSHAFLHPAGIEREILFDANRDTRTSVGSSTRSQNLDVNASSSSTLSQILLKFVDPHHHYRSPEHIPKIFPPDSPRTFLVTC